MQADTLRHMTMPPTSIPDRTTSATLLRLADMYARRGPFATMYVPTPWSADGSGAPNSTKLQELRSQLEADGASADLLRSIDGHVASSGPASAKAMCIIAAQDGASLVGYDLLPLEQDIAVLRPLPSAGLLLDWHQRRIPTLFLQVRDSSTEIISYAVRGLGRQRYSVGGTPTDVVHTVAKFARNVGARLVIVAGKNERTHTVAQALPFRLPLECRVVEDLRFTDRSDFASALARQLTLAAADTSLRHLRELRFLASHGAAVAGLDLTTGALRSGTAKALLTNCDLGDDRMIWIGDRAHHISTERTPQTPRQVHLVDGLVQCAIRQRLTVKTIPKAGRSGPSDGLAALTTTDFRSRLA